MGFQFQKATKTQARARVALTGPSGAGKTYTALAIAAGLGSRVALIDTERGSASKYADEFEFDCLELTSFSPETYGKAIRAAEDGGYDVVVIDSLSHAWNGKDGALEQVSNRGGRFDAWKDITPKQNSMIDAILGSKAHVIVTMRSKTEYVVAKENGKTTVEKVGLAPVQRDGVEYEFDAIGDLDHRHVLTISKSRCKALADQVIRFPGADVAEALTAWLTDGAPAPKPLVERYAEELDAATTHDAIEELTASIGNDKEKLSRPELQQLSEKLSNAKQRLVTHPAEAH